jgi:HSP20 family protein
MIKHVRATGLERLELQRLRDRVGRLFAALQEAMEAEDPLASGAWAPPVDLCETKEAIYVRVELPGLLPDQIKVGLTSSRLRIWGEKPHPEPRHRIISHLCSERSYGRFSRIVPLRWPISVPNSTATLADGVLLLTLPKITDRRGAEFRITVHEQNHR